MSIQTIPFKKTLLISVLGALFSSGALADTAKHIILLVGDGMNIEHEIAASRYLFGEDYALAFQGLNYQGNQATWDVSTYKYWSGGVYDPLAIKPLLGYDPEQGGKAPYPLGPELPGAQAYHLAKATDSASAATAWSTGFKTDDGNIAWLPGDPDDGALETIAETLRDDLGYAIGVVSTVPFTHATPAAFVSHNKSRNNYHAIAEEILTQVKPEVVIGGGYAVGSSCDSPLGSGYISLITYTAVCDDDDYVVVTREAGVDGGIAVLDAAQVASAEGRKLFGLFGGSGGNFESLVPYDLPGTPDVKQATVENPTFAEATLAALKVLSQDQDGFFLMAEQGDVDWANHANDFSRMVGTMKDLHDGTQAVIDFVNQPGDGITWDNTLLIVTSDHSNSYTRLIGYLGAGDLPYQDGKTYDPSQVTYGSTGHTNELTRIYAEGAGAQALRQYENRWYPGTRIVDNTHLYHVMLDAAGIPTASPLSLANPRAWSKR